MLDMTDNETAKLHLRHMVGGRLSEDIGDEMVFRVEFPERPGSLLQFLSVLGNEYSISLFHYRNRWPMAVFWSVWKCQRASVPI